MELHGKPGIELTAFDEVRLILIYISGSTSFCMSVCMQFVNVTGLSVGQGLATAVDTLCSQVTPAFLPLT